MWPVKQLAGTSPYTLFVVVGAASIECAVMHGSAARASWVADGRIEVDIESAGGLSPALSLAAEKIPELLIRLKLSSLGDIRVIVADCWLAVASLPWSPAVADSVNASAYARSHFAGMGFVIEPGDVIRLDEAPYGAPRLAVAYPSPLLEGLEQLVRAGESSLTSVLPWSVAAWAFVRRTEHRQLQALALLARGVVLVARGTSLGDSRLGEVTARRYASGYLPNAADLGPIWRRLCLREPPLAGVQQALFMVLDNDAGEAAGDCAPFVRLDLPTQGDVIGVSPALTLAAGVATFHSPFDAGKGRGRWTRWQWVALAASALLTLGLGFQAIDHARSARVLAERLSTSTKVLPAKSSTVKWSRDELAKVQAVNAAIRELNLPIAALLRSLEPPEDIRVAVLAIESAGAASEARNSSVRIFAEARTGSEMARYVAFVADRKPFTGAYLTKHEIVDTSPERPYRFTVEASWDD